MRITNIAINTKMRTYLQSLWNQRRNLYTTGCPKSLFLYFISLYFITIGLGKQIISTKVVSFNIVHYFHSCCASFDSYIRSVYFRAKGTRARVYVSVTYFLNFIARIARTPSKNVQLYESISLYTSIYWLICCSNC